MLDRRLHHILVVAQTNSFSRAAEKVGITQSGITRSIADLERELGYSLFNRTGRGVSATERGHIFIQRARQLLEDSRSLMLSGNGIDDTFARTLRIGVAPPSLEWRLADPLACLVEQHSSLRLELQGATAEQCQNNLRCGGIDVAFGFEDAFAYASDLKLVRIDEITPVLYARKGHPLTKISAITSAELARYECVTPPDSLTFGKWLREIFEAESVSWQRHIHIIDNQTVAYRLVERSNAFAITSEQVAQSPYFLESFDIITVNNLFMPIPLCCVTRARWELSKPVLAFLNVMKKMATKYSAGNIYEGHDFSKLWF